MTIEKEIRELFMSLPTWNVRDALLTCFGCANPNMIGQRGDDLNMKYSLQDRRAAKMHIKVVESVPSEAVKIGNFTVNSFSAHRRPH